MKKEIKISGMTCKHCVMHVNNALLELESVTEVKVSLEDALAVIEASKILSDEVLTEAITEIGYDVLSIREV